MLVLAAQGFVFEIFLGLQGMRMDDRMFMQRMGSLPCMETWPSSHVRTHASMQRILPAAWRAAHVAQACLAHASHGARWCYSMASGMLTALICRNSMNPVSTRIVQFSGREVL